MEKNVRTNILNKINNEVKKTILTNADSFDNIDSKINELNNNIIINNNEVDDVMFFGYNSKLSKINETNKDMYYKNLGKCYYYGIGVTKNYKRSLKYIFNSSYKNDKELLTIIGNIYLNGGYGVLKDKLKGNNFISASNKIAA